MIKTNVTMFGQTRNCYGTIYFEGGVYPKQDTWDEFVWVERPEDMYVLLSKSLMNKLVLVVKREDWLRGEELAKLTE